MATFWSEPPDLEEEVELILRFPQLLTDDQLINLQAILGHYGVDAVPYGADFNFKVEIEAQLAAVKALRAKVMGPGGLLLDGVSTREAKEVIGASSTLITTLMRHHEKIMNFERLRALEEAVKAAVQTLPEGAREAFFAEMERRLATCDS
jgi:hypothetical protein